MKTKNLFLSLIIFVVSIGYTFSQSNVFYYPYPEKIQTGKFNGALSSYDSIYVAFGLDSNGNEPDYNYSPSLCRLYNIDIHAGNYFVKPFIGFYIEMNTSDLNLYYTSNPNILYSVVPSITAMNSAMATVTATIPSSTSSLTEGSRLYWTTTRGRNAISVTAIGTGVVSYDALTGIINVPTPASYAMGVPASGGSITAGTPFQPNTSSDCFIDMLSTQGGLLSLVGTVTVQTCSTSGGTYLTRSIESLSLALLGTNANRSTTGISVPKGYYVKVTYSGTGAANLSSTYVQTAK